MASDTTPASAGAESIDELRGRVEHLELVLQATEEGLFEWNLLTGEVTCSPRWTAMLGYADDEVPATTGEWQQRVHPDDLEDTLRVIRDYLAGERATCEVEHRLRHKDGTYRWIYERAVARWDETGHAIRLVGSHADITARKLAEQELARRDAILEAVRFAAERFLRNLVSWDENIGDMLAMFGRALGVSRVYVFENDIDAQGVLRCYLRHEWTVTGVSPLANFALPTPLPFGGSGWQRWKDLLQRGEPVVGRTRDFPAHEQAELLREHTLSVVAVPIVVDGQWWGFMGFDDCEQERDWSAVEVDALKAAAGTLGGAIQRDRSEAASARLAAIVESTNDAIFGMRRDGIVTSWNAGAERLYGYTAAEMMGGTIHPLFPAGEMARLREVLVAITAGDRIDHFETGNIRKDGATVPVSMSFSLIRDAAGEVTGTSAIARDITDRKQAQAELARRDAILDAVRFAAERFLDRATSWEDSLHEVLARLGRATGVCQVYVARKWTEADGEIWSRTVQEWKARSESGPVSPENSPPITFRSLGLGHLIDSFSRGELVHGHAREFPGPARSYARDQGVLSFVIVPIFVDGQWWGTIGFDECDREREFPASERDALKAAAGTLGAAIGRAQAEERNAWLAAIVEGSDDAIVGRTMDNMIVSWNQGAERLYGYRADDVIGKSVDALLPEEEREAMDRIFAGLRHGESVAHYETSRQHRNGSRLMVSISSSPVRNQAGEVIGSASASRDISERLRAEAELRESQRSLRTLLSNLPGVAYRRRLSDDEWIMEFVSEGSLALSGYHPSQLIGPGRIPPANITHPEDRSRVLGEIEAAIAKDEPFQVTYRMRTASGAEKWVLDQGRGVRDESGQILAIEGIITDITERAQARQQLEQRVEERTRELATLLAVSTSIASTLELAPLLGVILDQLQQVVPHIAAAIFSLESDDQLRLLDYRGPIARADVDWIWPLREVGHSRAVIDGRAPVIIPDIKANTPLARAFRAKSLNDFGEVPGYVASWMGLPLVFRDQVIGILAVDGSEVDAYTARDAEIGAALASQAAIAIVNARLYERAQGTAALEERQRLARELHDSVSQALFGIGLGARTARTLLASDPGAAAAPLDYVLSLAEAGLTEMRALIFELRPEALEQEGLVAALEKQVATLRARHGITVEATLGDPGEVSLAVEEAIYRIAQEALNNIVKHAGATHVGLELARVGGRLALDIHDNGAGFDPAASFSGHLGLTTMRERAERLGGTLGLASAHGEGTQLHVELPV